VSTTKLKDIAEAAGVSINTVSRVLTGKTKGLRGNSAEKMERIQEIAREMNYTPNRAAQAMRTQRAFQIGVIAHEIHNPYTGRMLEIVGEELGHFGYSLLLGLVSEDKHKWDKELNDFSKNLMDGVLNYHPYLHGDELEHHMGGRPVFTFDRSPEESPAMLNMEGGVLLGMQHLRNLGHENIALVTGPGRETGHTRRITAFNSFYASQSINPPSEWVIIPGWKYDDGEAATDAFLKTGCTACLAGNDLLAVGLCTGLRMQGYEVPKDFSIVSMDDTILSKMNRPQLTTVRPPVRELARLSVEGLLARVEGKKSPAFQMLMPSLVVRDSSGALLAK